MTLEDLLDAPEFDHPKLRLWARHLDTQQALIEVRRLRDGITLGEPKLWIEFYSSDGTLLVSDSTDWEYGLDAALAERGVRARSVSAEAERFALVLKSAFEPLALRYNDDYFNAVLISFMRDAGLTEKEDIRNLLDDIPTHQPHMGASYGDCVDSIKAALGNVLRTLVTRLRYPRRTATDIVAAALKYWLDERFSVTSRRILGWAKPGPDLWSRIKDLAPYMPQGPTPTWTASADDLAFALEAHGFNTTAATIERELLEHSSRDSAFPWNVTLEAGSGKLRFAPKSS